MLLMDGEDSIAKLVFVWSVSLAAPIALVVSFFRWRRPPHDTRAFLWRSALALIATGVMFAAVISAVSLDGYFSETWRWLGVLFKRNPLKAWSALLLGSAGALSIVVLDPPRWWPGGRGTRQREGR
jgi:hypothetical protein